MIGAVIVGGPHDNHREIVGPVEGIGKAVCTCLGGGIRGSGIYGVLLPETPLLNGPVYLVGGNVDELFYLPVPSGLLEENIGSVNIGKDEFTSAKQGPFHMGFCGEVDHMVRLPHEAGDQFSIPYVPFDEVMGRVIKKILHGVGAFPVGHKIKVYDLSPLFQGLSYKMRTHKSCATGYENPHRHLPSHHNVVFGALNPIGTSAYKFKSPVKFPVNYGMAPGVLGHSALNLLERVGIFPFG